MFKDNLIELRKYHDVSQEELADMIGGIILIRRALIDRQDMGIAVFRRIACMHA